MEGLRTLATMFLFLAFFFFIAANFNSITNSISNFFDNFLGFGAVPQVFVSLIIFALIIVMLAAIFKE